MFVQTRRIYTAIPTILLLTGIVLGRPRFDGPETLRAGMALIKGGMYVPFAKEDGHKVKVRIKSFYVDNHAVTNTQYLDFVKANPDWRRSTVKPIFADGNYLRNWSGDLTLGIGAPPNDPVVYVSWFAARAYCAWRGKRLPTLNEWDYAMGGTRHESDKEILNIEMNRWYGTKNPRENRQISGTGGGSGLAARAGRNWEWVEDFGSALLGGLSDGSEEILSCGGAAADFSDPTNYSAFLRYAFLSGLKPNYCLPNLGFRPVKSVDQTTER